MNSSLISSFLHELICYHPQVSPTILLERLCNANPAGVQEESGRQAMARVLPVTDRHSRSYALPQALPRLPPSPVRTISEVMDDTGMTSLEQDERKSRAELITDLRSLRMQSAAMAEAIQAIQSRTTEVNNRIVYYHREQAALESQIARLTGRRLSRSSAQSNPFAGPRVPQESMEAREEANSYRRPEQATIVNAVTTASGPGGEETRPTLFTYSLSHYKRKHQLVAITQALQISSNGTIPQLIARIKDHLASHSDLVTDLRFTGLYSGKNRTSDHWQAGMATQASPAALETQSLSHFTQANPQERS